MDSLRCHSGVTFQQCAFIRCVRAFVPQHNEAVDKLFKSDFTPALSLIIWGRYTDVLGTVLCCPDTTATTDALILPVAEGVGPWRLSEEGYPETTLHQKELPCPVLCPVPGAFHIQRLVEVWVRRPRPLSQLEGTQKGHPRSELPVTTAETGGGTTFASQANFSLCL